MSGGRRSTSPAVASRHGKGYGYHSTNGEFNYYPTSAHKRGQDSEVDVDRDSYPSVTKNKEDVKFTPVSKDATRTEVSPSSVGLSRSPSQPTPAKHVVTFHQSASEPLSATLTQPMERSTRVTPTAAAAAIEFANDSAPLLHRYCTSQKSVQRRASARSTSSPAQALQQTLSAVNGNAVKKTTRNIKRSLLKVAVSNTRKVGPSIDLADESAAFCSLRANDSSIRVDETKTVETQLKVADSTCFSSSQKGKGAKTIVVPVARVCLMGRGDSVAGSEIAQVGEHGASKADQILHNTVSIETSKQKACGVRSSQTSDAEVGESQKTSAPLKATKQSCALLAKDARPQLFCSDKHCIHSEDSIGEFILMQRELRRCYATIEDYGIVVAQLRQECTDAWAAYHQLQRQCVQHEAEAGAAVCTELTEQFNPFCRHQHNADVKNTAEVKKDDAEIVDSSGSAADKVVNVCLESALQETLEELQRALQQEKAAHEVTRRLMDEAIAKQNYWELRAVELQQWQRRTRQQQEDISPESAHTADGHTKSTPTSSAQLSPSHTLFHKVSEKEHIHQLSSSESSPAPRFHSPHPHHAATPQHTLLAPGNATLADASVLTAFTEKTSVRELGTETALTCVVKDTMNNASASAQAETDSSKLSQRSFIGESVEAVGSGVVVVEPPPRMERSGAREQQLAPYSSQSKNPLRKTATKTGDGKRSQAESTDAQSVRSPPASFQADAKYTTDGVIEPPTQSGAPSASKRLALLLDNITLSTNREQQQQELTFPRPSFAQITRAAAPSENAFLPWTTKNGNVAQVLAVESTERRCTELLCALMDKERQLAVIAEERTKYKRLYEDQTSSVKTGSSWT